MNDNTGILQGASQILAVANDLLGPAPKTVMQAAFIPRGVELKRENHQRTRTAWSRSVELKGN